jgi:hypothetical protein
MFGLSWLGFGIQHGPYRPSVDNFGKYLRFREIIKNFGIIIKNFLWITGNHYD